jgi:Flp pilus assembly protein TadD
LTDRRLLAVLAALAAACATTAGVAGAAGRDEQVPTQLIDRFPLNPEKHKGPSDRSQPKQTAATGGIRGAGPGSGSPAVWLLLLVGVVGILVGVLVARVSSGRWARGRAGRRPASRAPPGPAIAARVAGASAKHRPAAASVPASNGTSRQRRVADSARPRAPNRVRPEVEFDRGSELQIQGDLTGAESAYRRADDGGHPGAAFALGMLLEERGDHQGAEAAYRRADERGGGAAAANLGVLLEQRGDLAGAEAAYRRADERDDATGAYNLAALLAQRGELAGAGAAYRRAAVLGDGDVAAMAKKALRRLGATAR